MIFELENIAKSYYSGKSTNEYQVLKGITLSLEEGKIITITGPSGCGKSTLLNIIGTMDSPTSGEVMFQDRSLRTLNGNELANIRNTQIGFIFQSHHLLPQLNILENVLLPTIVNSTKKEKTEAKYRALELISRIGLSDHIYKLPSELSGGECQRVAVVRSLINKPQIILADEPTGSLDEENTLNIGKLLLEINDIENIALVVVTHSTELAQLIGNQHKLTNGKLIKVA